MAEGRGNVGDGAVVGAGEGAAGEDVRGCEGGGGADALKEEDLVARGDEEDACEVVLAGFMVLW